MKQYNTDERRLQVVSAAKNNKDEQKATDYVDIDTGDWVPGLYDPKYAWRSQKQKTLKMATLYRVGGDGSRADRAVSCSTWLQYLATDSGDERTLKMFNACHNRLCPICSSRKARLMRIRLTKILKQAKKDHDEHTQLIFLTLTLENCSGDKLRDTLTLITKAWFKLIRRRPFARAVKGWFRAIEITRNSSDGTYHPHVHAILVVEDDYFRRSKKLYLTNDDYAKMWQESLQVDYTPFIGIQSTYVKGQKTKKKEKAIQAELDAAAEAAKYATKDSEWLDESLPENEAADILRTYTDALHGKRMTALGGWLKDAARALELDLEEDGDLVHDEDSAGGLTDETAEVLEIYGWHHGVKEHVLKGKIKNPLYAGGESEDEHDEGRGKEDTEHGHNGHGGVQADAAPGVSAERDKATGVRDTGNAVPEDEELGGDAAHHGRHGGKVSGQAERRQVGSG